MSFVAVVMLMFNHLRVAKTKLQMEVARFARALTSLGCVFFWCGVIVWTSSTFFFYLCDFYFVEDLCCRERTAIKLIDGFVFLVIQSTFFFLPARSSVLFYAGATALEGLCVCKVEFSD